MTNYKLMNDKVLFTNKWIEVRQRDFFVYIHNPWCNSKGVGILPYRKKVGKSGIEEVEYLGVLEVSPAHGEEPKLGVVTGGYDKEGETFAACAVRELEEEGGVVVNEGELVSLGHVRPSKASDGITYLYAVEVLPHHSIVEIKGDGTVGEEGITPIWVTKEEAVFSQDPLFATLISRLELALSHH